jgi:CheY-like chemotaxis protein
VALQVLVVDDNEINLRLVEHALAGRGFVVELAASGPEALAALDRSHPDLVILDIIMPGMSGMEVLDRIKSNPRTADIPVIMLTARTADQDVIAGYQQGADYFIMKPLVPRQLLYGIGLVLGRKGKDGKPKPPAEAPARPASATAPARPVGVPRSRS